MVGFNWGSKNNQLSRWCNHTLQVVFLFPSYSLFSSSTITSKQFSSTIKALWISIYEICFPQKYIIKAMHSGGIRPANLQLLFSSKRRRKPADCAFFRLGIVRPSFRQLAEGLPLILPCITQGYEYNTTNRQGV